MAPFGTRQVTLPTSRAALFVDGANMYAAAKNLGWEIDWDKVLAYYQKKYDLIRAYYYTAIPDGEARIRPMVDYLNYNGWTVISKPTKEYTDVSGRLKIKGNMDMEMALDVIDMAESPSDIIDIILFTGDGDFKVLAARVQQRGCRVHAVSTAVNEPAIAAEELRRQVDFFYELNDLRTEFRRERE